jgi:SAM-dependent methyltransferase
MPAANDIRGKIIDYWDKARLCSPESSTSQGDPAVKLLENRLELRRLRQILDRHKVGGRALDVGAGYGRFAPLLIEYVRQLVMIEPAEALFQSLRHAWSQDERVRTEPVSLEEYHDERPFDFVLASGVIYLYDDAMTLEFFNRAKRCLKPGGLFVARDFLIDGGNGVRVHDSTYVPGAKCHYRSIDFWRQAALQASFKLIDFQPSRPLLSLFDNPRWARILGKLRLKWLLRLPSAVSVAEFFGRWKSTRKTPEPYYIVMRRNSDD